MCELNDDGDSIMAANWGVVYHQQALECLSWQVETPNFPFLKSATIALYRTLQKGAPNLHPKAQRFGVRGKGGNMFVVVRSLSVRG